MTEVDATNKNWFPSINQAIEAEAIKCFSTKKAALAVAKEFGWKSNVIRVIRRHEKVWIVGMIPIHPDETCGVVVDTLRVPMLRYETGEDGTQRQPVCTFRISRELL